MSKQLAVILAATALLTACSSDKKVVEGERVNILTVAAPKSANVAPQLEAAQRNSLWAQAGGNAQGNMGALAIADNISQRWQTRVGMVRDKNGFGAVAAPVATKEAVYILNGRAQVTALAADTGNILWELDLTPEGSDSRAGYGGGLAINDDTLIVATGFGTLSLVNIADGKVKTSVKMDRAIRAAPITDGKTIIVRTIDDRLVFCDAQSLRVLRTMRTPPVVGAGYPYAHAALSNTLAAIPLSSGEVMLLGQLNGEQQSITRSLQPSGAMALRGTGYVAVRSPLIADNAVYATAEGGQTAAWSRTTGETLWQQPIASIVPLQKVGNALFGVTVSGDVFALRHTDGQLLYSRTLPAARKNTPQRAVSLLPVGNQLAVLTAQGQLFLVAAGNGMVQKTFDAPRNGVPMSVANGVLYIAGDDVLTAWY
jgi:outer membrane protein assembly factor BamB